MGSNMFVIGSIWNLTCEVFDNICKKFTFIKKMLKCGNLDSNPLVALGIGRKIIAFSSIFRLWQVVHIYATLRDQWS